MTDLEVRIGGRVVDPASGWTLAWDDRDHGTGRLVGEGRSVPVVVELDGPEGFVTIAGRRVHVAVWTWRERVLAEAETEARTHAGPMDVKATLPGLVVAVAVRPDDEVEEGTALLTIEAMKMQNEVRAPRGGRVVEIAVTAGQTVATGALLLRLE
jgi:acetyl/propionyl-CoA carboxylase alpha subunit